MNNYGEGIQVIRTDSNWKKVNEIDFVLDVVAMGEPSEKTRTIIDIHVKDYANYGTGEQDETGVKVFKTSSRNEGNRRQYSFTSTSGIISGPSDYLGAKVLGLAVGGGSTAIRGNHNDGEIAGYTSQTGFDFSYNEEEKLHVPPGKSVKATYSIKYEVNYVLRFSIPRDTTIPLLYLTKCQSMCFGCCRSNGFVLVRDLISTLPNYSDEGGMASFTQTGILSWIGEACSVKKVEEEAAAL